MYLVKIARDSYKENSNLAKGRSDANTILSYSKLKSSHERKRFNESAEKPRGHQHPTFSPEYPKI